MTLGDSRYDPDILQIWMHLVYALWNGFSLLCVWPADNTRTMIFHAWRYTPPLYDLP